MIRRPRSIRARLTLWYVAALAVLLAIFSAGVYLALRDALRDNLDETIESRATVLLSIVQVEDGQPSLPLQSSLIEADEAGDVAAELDDEQFVRLYDAAGVLVLDASDPDGPVALDAGVIRRSLEGDVQWVDMRGEEDRFRVLVLPVVRDGDVAGVLEVGQATEDVEETLGALLAIIVVGFPLALLASGLAGAFLARRALAPIDSITGTARRISAADLSRRLDLDLPDDELGRLARTFDDMLARLEDAFRRQRQFTADASHELRTPLTIMKGQIDVALSRPREAAAYRETLVATGEETDRLIGLVNSLLTLARADAGQIPIQRERLDVATLAAMALDPLRPLAAERGVSLAAGGPALTIEADETLVLQLLLNLLDNAIEHTPPGGAVRVTWALDRGRLRLEVADNGEGIPAEHLARLFDRFYRVDTARSRAQGGAGIGLAICRWIAEAHGGSISVESEFGRGSTFTVDLPAAGAV